jgi:DNA replication licensing factor MCM4
LAISQEAKQELIDSYLQLRKLGGAGSSSSASSSSSKQITATTRQLESLIRISESLARIRLRDSVQAEDVREATRLMKVSLYRALMQSSDQVDMDLLYTGYTRS